MAGARPRAFAWLGVAAGLWWCYVASRRCIPGAAGVAARCSRADALRLQLALLGAARCRDSLVAWLGPLALRQRWRQPVALANRHSIIVWCQLKPPSLCTDEAHVSPPHGRRQGHRS